MLRCDDGGGFPRNVFNRPANTQRTREQQQQQAPRLSALTEVWPTWPASATRSGPAAVAAGDDEDVGTGVDDSGAVSKGSSGTVTIWSSLQRPTPDRTPDPRWLTPPAVLETPERRRSRRLVDGKSHPNVFFLNFWMQMCHKVFPGQNRNF